MLGMLQESHWSSTLWGIPCPALGYITLFLHSAVPTYTFVYLVLVGYCDHQRVAVNLTASTETHICLSKLEPIQINLSISHEVTTDVKRESEEALSYLQSV